MTKFLNKLCNWIMPSAAVNLLGVFKIWKREQVYKEKRLVPGLILFLSLCVVNWPGISRNNIYLLIRYRSLVQTDIPLLLIKIYLSCFRCTLIYKCVTCYCEYELVAQLTMARNRGHGARGTAAAISYFWNKHGDFVYKEMCEVKSNIWTYDNF